MIKIDVHSDIANQSEGVFLSMMGLDSGVFSLDKVKQIFEENPNEKDFLFNIHCNGGSTSEGLAIYDFLRTSGKNIYCNIEGSCHSMAVSLLLAAPVQNRSAQPNARAIIHKVYTSLGTAINKDDAEMLTYSLKGEQEKIAKLYSERTSLAFDDAMALMNFEKEHTADDLLKYGFISKINKYKNKININQKERKMKDVKREFDTFKNRVSNSIQDLQKYLGLRNQPFRVRMMNFDWNDADGNVLFTTDAEDNTLEVGMPATPDGTFTIEADVNGEMKEVTVIIEEGIITEIQGLEETEAPESSPENRIRLLENKVAVLTTKLTNATKLLVEANNKITSNYVVPGRVSVIKPTVKNKRYRTIVSEERKASIKENMNKISK